MKGLPFDRLVEIDDLLERVLDLPEDHRGEFLDRECRDPEVRQAVQGLIWAEATSRKLFDSSDAGSWLGWERGKTGMGPRVGDQIQEFRLVEVLGRGGSATVFRAERVQGGFHQEVALKVLDVAVLSPDALERFRLERQILAGLQHPNVARLIAGGVTEEGRPYIVMEFVDGTPIDRHCDSHRLSITERVELFRVVCAAVEAANQKLIVHRDLKPGNVLVTRSGSVKLLDFGIAKLLEPSPDSGMAIDTKTGVHPMTPAYASPEQALGLPITTATDVYQLGVLLYELLCGRRPRDESARSLSEIRDWLGGTAIEPPSRALERRTASGASDLAPRNGDATEPREIARRRRTSLERLRSRLRGDLDQITIKALHAEAGARYASVAELEADLGRFIRGRPVRARPPALGYRARKFVLRHRAGTILAVAAVTIISYLGIGLVSQYRATVVERDKAAAVSTYMIDMFARANPWQGSRDTLTAIGLLQEGAARIDSDLAEEPLVRAAMAEAIGRALVGLGELDRAEVLMESSLALRREHLPPDSPDLLSSLDAMADWMVEARRVGEAEPLFQEAVRIARATHGPETRATAAALAGRAYVQHLLGNPGEAETDYAEALRIYSLPKVEPDEKAAETMSNLGWLLLSEGRPVEAEEWMRRGFELRLDLHGPDHPLVANSLAGLARITGVQGRWESSLHLSERVLRIRLVHFPPDHPWIGDAYGQLAKTQSNLGKFDEAEASFRESIRITSISRGPRSPDLALPWNDLAIMLRAQAKFQEAEGPAREALAIYSETRGERHLFTAIAAHNLASILAPLEKVEEAERFYRFSLEAKLESGPASHPGVAQTKSALGGLLVDMERPEEAEPLLREAIEVQMAALGRGHWQTGLTLIYLGQALESLAGPGNGRALVDEGYEAVLAGLGPANVETLAAEMRVARLVESQS